MMVLTDSAADKVQGLMAKDGKAGYGLRMRVIGGGCAGLQYQMGFEEAATERDKVFDLNGVRVFMDPKSLLYLAGVKLDYVDGLYGAGFKFDNPNAANTCGCGKSFS